MNIDEAKLLVSIYDKVLKVVDLREMRPIITAWAEGKKIQLNHGTGQGLHWYDCYSTCFDYPHQYYRVKPTIVEFTYEGQVFKIDLNKAKELNLLK